MGEFGHKFVPPDPHLKKMDAQREVKGSVRESSQLSAERLRGKILGFTKQTPGHNTVRMTGEVTSGGIEVGKSFTVRIEGGSDVSTDTVTMVMEKSPGSGDYMIVTGSTVYEVTLPVEDTVVLED